MLTVSEVTRPTLEALEYAVQLHPDQLYCVHIDVDEQQRDRVKAAWQKKGLSPELEVIDSPYRGITRPLVGYVRRRRRRRTTRDPGQCSASGIHRARAVRPVVTQSDRSGDQGRLGGRTRRGGDKRAVPPGLGRHRSIKPQLKPARVGFRRSTKQDDYQCNDSGQERQNPAIGRAQHRHDRKQVVLERGPFTKLSAGRAPPADRDYEAWSGSVFRF